MSIFEANIVEIPIVQSDGLKHFTIEIRNINTGCTWWAKREYLISSSMIEQELLNVPCLSIKLIKQELLRTREHLAAGNKLNRKAWRAMVVTEEQQA